MGSGIAAHVANLGFEVALLDVNRDAAKEAFERAKRARPSHFFLPSTADRIQLGAIDLDTNWIAEADWVCEAIIEKLSAKRALFEQIESVIRPDAMVSTNTSGLQIGLLSEGRSDSFQRRFLGTHFFNPPRYLKLLELIPTDKTHPQELERMRRFLEEEVARRVVVAKDTPGFIANRFGMWAMIHAIHTAEKLQLTVEQVDAITGPFLGRPRSASFRLNDLVGLDIMQDIASNLYERCNHDPQRENLRMPASMEVLLERGWIGEKAGQGYYRREGKELLAFDLQTHAYRDKREVAFDSIESVSSLPLGERIAALLEKKDEVGTFLNAHLVPVLKYADKLKEEISHSVLDFDRVMKWGFGWEQGPFEMIDSIGYERLGVSDGVFYMPGAVRSFSGGFTPLPQEPQFRSIEDFPVIEVGEGFEIRSLDDGLQGICITTKMGVITPALVTALTDWIKDQSGRFVFTSSARSFSVGYDLKFVLANSENHGAVDTGLRELQALAELLSTKRIVCAVFGHCLGAGLELAMACPAIVAAVDAQIGLPEAKVGLIPGGSGTATMRLRAQGDGKRLSEIAFHLSSGLTSSNAPEALRLGYLRESDSICFHPDLLLHSAMKLAREIEPAPAKSWSEQLGPIGGMIDQLLEDAKGKGDFSDYDVTIGHAIKAVFKSVSWDEALAKERLEFGQLMRHALTAARIKHTLETGKPLRN